MVFHLMFKWDVKTYQLEVMTVIWKRSRDCSRDKPSRQRNSETWWRRVTATLLGVSFGIYKRRRRDLLMGRRGYLPLRRLGDIPLRRHWVFHLRRTSNVAGRYKEMSLRRSHNVLLLGGPRCTVSSCNFIYNSWKRYS